MLDLQFTIIAIIAVRLFTTDTTDTIVVTTDTIVVNKRNISLFMDYLY